jgi:undecaprenyl diphosphate synthase
VKKALQELVNKLDPAKLPVHVAIIMDGNGRWAKQRHRPRLYGHRAGAKAVREVVEIAGELYIPHLSVYAFSTENWSRPQDEVSGLFNLFMQYLKSEVDELNRRNVVLKIIGSSEKVNPDFLSKAHKIASKTWNNTGLHLNVMFNYGGRQDIVQAFQKIASRLNAGECDADMISEDMISDHLYTSGIPDPDLVIRTSGEYRLSNFLIWQTAYSELYITDTLWPDFGKIEFVKALLDYQTRKRRFGGIGE